MDSSKFFSLLFDDEEMTCFSSDPYGITVYNVHNPIHHFRAFFSINPMIANRADANVTKYRNILIEMDKLPLPEQMFLLEDMPVSSIVYSGGKSYHAIISLTEPCETRAEYDDLVRRVHARVPDADKSTKNPSRFSRTPEALRNNGKRQDLIYVGERVSREAVEAWLGPELKSEPAQRYETDHEVKGWYKILTPFTNHFLRHGAEEGTWHNELVKAVCDMTRAGYDISEIEAKVCNITGTLDKHDRNTIKSCYNMVKGLK